MFPLGKVWGDQMNEIIKQIIKDTLSGRRINKLILFGSRARNEYSSTSDYDILVILEDSIQMTDRIKLSSSIRKKLAQQDIDADIIIKSREEATYYQNKTGSIVKAALNEGIVL